MRLLDERERKAAKEGEIVGEQANDTGWGRLYAHGRRQAKAEKGQYVDVTCQMNTLNGPEGEKGGEGRAGSRRIGEHTYRGKGGYSKKGRVMSKGDARKSGNRLYAPE